MIFPLKFFSVTIFFIRLARRFPDCKFFMDHDVFSIHPDNFWHWLSKVQLITFLLLIQIFFTHSNVQFFTPIFQLQIFLSIPNVLRILKLENCFKKIGLSEKIFSQNTSAKIFLVVKLVQKVDLIREQQVLSRKIGIKSFSSICEFEDRFQIFNFSGKFFVEKLV